MGCASSHPHVDDEHDHHVEVCEPRFGTDLPHLEVAGALAELLQHAFDCSAPFELGYTTGHSVIEAADQALADKAQASLLYGEILPTELGLFKLMDDDHLGGAQARRFVDCGSGSGRLALAAFLGYLNLAHVLAVELSPQRHALAAEAIMRLVQHNPQRFILDTVSETRVRVVDVAPRQVREARQTTGQAKAEQARLKPARARVLELMCGDMWKVSPHYITAADVMLLHTEFTETSLSGFKHTLKNMRSGCRFLTYNDPRPWFRGSDGETEAALPFVQVKENEPEDDVFQTSWAHKRGHHLFCWQRVQVSGDCSRLDASSQEESKRCT